MLGADDEEVAKMMCRRGRYGVGWGVDKAISELMGRILHQLQLTIQHGEDQ